MAAAQKKNTYTAAEVAVLEETILKQKNEIEELKRKLAHMNEVFANAQRARFGQSSEKASYVMSEDQIGFFNEAEKEQDHKAEEALNAQAVTIGITFSKVLVENVSLPDEVERLIDEQSGIGMATRNMESFVQYQTARAMRDAAKQEGGLAGLGAGLALGNTMAHSISDAVQPTPTAKSKVEQLRELKSLLDDGILTQEEFDEEKRIILA